MSKLSWRSMGVLLGALAVAVLLVTACAPSPAAENKLEVFSWWTTGGEAAGLLKLFDLYNQQYPNVEIINATVAGGAGFEAKPALVARMQAGDPPDSFQVHMGHELIDTWVTAGKMEPITFIFEEEGWKDIFPQGVLDIVSYNGDYWSVPVNIHRANVLWYNEAIFAENNLTPPTTFDEFFAVADTLQAAGITPLALGDVGIWASTHLFETVLIGTLGADGYKGLWTGETDWNSPEVTQALETFAHMLDYVNADHAALEWSGANQLLIDGQAAMTIMGDWVDADYVDKLGSKDYEGFGHVPAPGNAGIYDALSDTFGLPVGAPDRENVIAWLRLIGSKAGQEAFNPLKGSVCARTDCDPSLFGPYLQSAIQDWSTDTIVPSLAHGAAASESWATLFNDAMTAFVTDRDVAKAQAAMADACVQAGVCQ